MVKKLKTWVDDRVSPWVKVLVIVATTLGISETCGLAGPCASPDWAFQSKAEAQEVQKKNTKIHVELKTNDATTNTKLDAIQNNQDMIFQAFPKTWRERGHKHKKGRK